MGKQLMEDHKTNQDNIIFDLRELFIAFFLFKFFSFKSIQLSLSHTYRKHTYTIHTYTMHSYINTYETKTLGWVEAQLVEFCLYKFV